jgi:hypothetical protein
MANVVRLEPVAGRVPPNDLDAEAAVISAALLDSETIAVSRAIVRPEHFYADANRRIFETILGLSAAGQPADVVAVAGWLRDKGRLDQIGGTPYLGLLADATPAVSNVAAHARRVHEKWRIRQLISTCQKFAAEGYGDFGDVQAFADQASAALRDIATSSSSGSKIALLNADEIFAPLAEPDFVIDQVVRCASITEIVGYGGGSKTWTAVAMMIAVGAGQMWLGRFRTKAGRAAYLDYENGSYEMRRRLKAVARSMGLEWVAGVSLAPMPSVYMSDGESFGAALAPLAKTHSLIIIDTLKAASPGVDENDSNMRVGLDALRRVAESTGCAFVVLVHAKKTSGSVTTIDPREAGRGSSAIFDAADSVLHITYTEGKPLRVTQTKARLGKTFEPFEVSITDGEDGAILVRASDVTVEQDATTSSRAKFEALCDRVLDAVKANPGSSGRIIRQLTNGNRDGVLNALEHLEHHGAIRNTGTERAAKWFPTGKPSRSETDEWAAVGEDV